MAFKDHKKGVFSSLYIKGGLDGKMQGGRELSRYGFRTSRRHCTNFLAKQEFPDI